MPIATSTKTRSSDALKLENQLCFPLYAASRLVIKRYRPFLDPLGLTYTQYITMLSLWEKDAETVNQLGEKLYLDSGTLTPLLKKLEAQGFIRRQRDSADERNVRVFLTQTGKKLQQKALLIPEQMSSCIIMHKKDARSLQQLLHGLINALTDQD